MEWSYIHFFKKVFGYSPTIGAIIVSVGIDFKQIVTRAHSSVFLSRWDFCLFFLL